MWDMLVRIPRGRISTRKYLSVAATFLVVCFAYIFATAPTTYAADATWKGTDIVYQQNTYTGPTISKGIESHNLPKDTQIYTYTEVANASNGGSTKTAHLIYFPSGTDPSTATSASYKTYLVSSFGDYLAPSAVKSITLGASTTPATVPAATTSCAVDGVGWIVCSMSSWIADGVDYLYGIISKFFVVQPLTSASPTNSMYSLWQAVRNVANVAFVIAFLIVIYSQITNNVMSNYTVKKMIPRIIVAAILVNTSYWICAVAIDISNILGIAIQDLLTNMREGLGAANMADIPTWGDVTAGILSGTGLVVGGSALLLASGGTVGGLVFLLLGALLPAIFAALVAVAILAARQAIITLFVIIAPLAFVAYLLPNTEDWFNRWRKLFITALIMFPAFSLIFGAAQLTGVIIIQNAHGDISIALLGLTVQVVPLFVTPFLIKLSSGLLGTIAGMANDRSKGMFDRTKNWAGANREFHRQRGFSTPRRTGIGRLRPTNVARGLNNRSLYRDQMTAAHKSMAEGSFANTRRGTRVYNRSQDATLEKHAGEEANYRNYKEAMATGTDTQNTRRRHLHHQAHLDKGFGDVYEESMTNHAELDFRGQVARNVNGIGDIKVQADVDAGLAENKKKLVASQGQLALKQLVQGDRALSHEVEIAMRLEKQATEYDTIVQKAAEAAYDNYSRTNAAAQNLRLRAVEQTDQAKLADQQWNTVVEESYAKGTSADAVIGSNATVAQNLKDIQTHLGAEEKRIENAKFAQRRNIVEAFKEDQALRDYAGGVEGKAGATRIQAQVTKEFVDESVKAVMTNRALTSQLTRNQLKKMFYGGVDENGNTVTTEMQQAAMYELLQEKGNNMDAQEIRDAVVKKGFHYDENADKYYEFQRDGNGRVVRDARGWPVPDTSHEVSAEEAGNRRDWEQFFVDAEKGSPHNLGSLSGTNKSEGKAGNLVDDTRYAFMRDALGGKFGPEKVLKMDVDELKILAEDIQRPDGEYAQLDEQQKAKVNTAFENAVIGLQTHPSYKGQIDDRNRGVMNDILARINPAYNTGRVDAEGNPVFDVRSDNSIVASGSAEAEKQFAAPIRVDVARGDTVFSDRDITDV